MKKLTADIELLLLSRVALGDHAAFRDLYDAYHTTVYSFAYSLTHSHIQSEEITQDVFIKVWELREELHRIHYFSTWIRTIARNAAYGFFRRAAIESKVLNSMAGQQYEFIQPAVLTEFKELQREIHLFLSGLTEQQSLIYRLSREEGRTYAEIATQLNISVHTVKYHLTNIYQQLRSRLGPMFLLWMLTKNI